MVPERKRDGNFMKDRNIHSVSNMWSAAQRHKKIYRFGVNVWFE